MWYVGQQLSKICRCSHSPLISLSLKMRLLPSLGYMTYFRRRSESLFCIFPFSDSFNLKYSICQGDVFWDIMSCTMSGSQKKIQRQEFLILLSLPKLRTWQPHDSASFGQMVMKDQRWKCHRDHSSRCKATSENHWHPGYGHPPGMCTRLL